MEEKKNNSGLVVALVAFIALSIGLGGYLVYDNISEKANEKTSETDKSTKAVNDSNKDSNVENNKGNRNEVQSKTGVTNFYFDGIAILNEGSVYVNVNGSTREVNELFGKNAYKTLEATRKKYKTYSFTNFEYTSAENKSFTGMKLNTSNVKKIYTFSEGQALNNNYGLVLLNEDKTLSIISLYSLIKGSTTVKKVSGLSNIEKVVSEQNYGVYTYAIDENGKKYDLSDYVPKSYKQF